MYNAVNCNYNDLYEIRSRSRIAEWEKADKGGGHKTPVGAYGEAESHHLHTGKND